MADERNFQKTLLYINEAQGRYMLIKDVVIRNRNAFAYARGIRRLGDDPWCKKLGIVTPIVATAPYDPNRADAEHYLYARYLASSTGDRLTGTLVVGYEAVKAGKFARGKEKEMRTDPRYPVLPPSIDSITWGLSGANDGLEDFRKMHQGELGKLGSAWTANQDLAKKQY